MAFDDRSFEKSLYLSIEFIRIRLSYRTVENDRAQVRNEASTTTRLPSRRAQRRERAADPILLVLRAWNLVSALCHALSTIIYTSPTLSNAIDIDRRDRVQGAGRAGADA